MLTKNDLLSSIENEFRICVHLFERIPEGGFEYRPTSSQRSTEELLRYLSFHVLGFVSALVDDSWDRYKTLAAESESLDVKHFPQAMENQLNEIKACLDPVAETELQTKEVLLPWGQNLPLGRALLELPYRCIVGYRMQLFLYARAAGNDKLNTPNCWAGYDAQFN